MISAGTWEDTRMIYNGHGILMYANEHSLTEVELTSHVVVCLMITNLVRHLRARRDIHEAQSSDSLGVLYPVSHTKRA